MTEDKNQEAIMQQLYQQYQQLNDHINKLNNAKEQLENTKQAIDEFEKIQGNEEILAPIANGIFINAKLLDSKKLKVNVGSDLVIDKTIDETRELLQKQEKEIDKSLQDATTKLKEIEMMFQGN
ncbi:prefoldin subunit alpha [Candidatus Woesearchaeota archaeon]|nr:prefoldin subunit alpha [Candidatus Woesearchaeota archaeon]